MENGELRTETANKFAQSFGDESANKFARTVSILNSQFSILYSVPASLVNHE